MLKWIASNSFKLKPITRAKLYVALTRARYSSAIVCKDRNVIDHNAFSIPVWHYAKNAGFDSILF